MTFHRIVYLITFEVVKYISGTPPSHSIPRNSDFVMRMVMIRSSFSSLYKEKNQLTDMHSQTSHDITRIGHNKIEEQRLHWVIITYRSMDDP